MPDKMHIITVVWLLALQMPALAHGEEKMPPREEKDQPSLELLEFLGDFSSKDGASWVDPEELGKMDLADQEDKTDESKKK